MLYSVDTMARRMTKEVRQLVEHWGNPLSSMFGGGASKQIKDLQVQVQQALDELQKQQMELFRQTNDYVQARMKELAEFQANAMQALISAIPDIQTPQSKPSEKSSKPRDRAGREVLGDLKAVPIAAEQKAPKRRPGSAGKSAQANSKPVAMVAGGAAKGNNPPAAKAAGRKSSAKSKKGAGTDAEASKLKSEPVTNETNPFEQGALAKH